MLKIEYVVGLFVFIHCVLFAFRVCFMFEFMTFVTTTTVSIETRDRFLSASPAALRLSSSVSGLPPVRSWSKRPEAMPEGPALSERNRRSPCDTNAKETCVLTDEKI